MHRAEYTLKPFFRCQLFTQPEQITSVFYPCRRYCQTQKIKENDYTTGIKYLKLSGDLLVFVYSSCVHRKWRKRSLLCNLSLIGGDQQHFRCFLSTMRARSNWFDRFRYSSETNQLSFAGKKAAKVLLNTPNIACHGINWRSCGIKKLCSRSLASRFYIRNA